MKLCGKNLHDLDDPAVAYIVPSTGERCCRPCNRAWRAENPERAQANDHAWLVANPIRHRTNNRTWRKRNPDRVRLQARNSKERRRARIARVLATLTLQEWEAILDAAGHACIYCGSQKQITQDHLTPISRGGDHTADNVAPACRPCNTSKGAKVVMEFLAEAR